MDGDRRKEGAARPAWDCGINLSLASGGLQTNTNKWAWYFGLVGRELLSKRILESAVLTIDGFVKVL